VEIIKQIKNQIRINNKKEKKIIKRKMLSKDSSQIKIKHFLKI
jgi:hypothetical protein